MEWSSVKIRLLSQLMNEFLAGKLLWAHHEISSNIGSLVAYVGSSMITALDRSETRDRPGLISLSSGR